jgi:hypothetical protein
MVHPSPVQRTLILSPEVVGNEEDKYRIKQHVKALTGVAEVEVLAVRKIAGPDGKPLSFEVDIR